MDALHLPEGQHLVSSNMFTERIRLDDSTENQLLLFRPKMNTNLMANNSEKKKKIR